MRCTRRLARRLRTSPAGALDYDGAPAGPVRRRGREREPDSDLWRGREPPSPARSSRRATSSSGPWTIALLLGTGLFLTLRYRFVQLAHFARGAARSMRPRAVRRAAGALTPFQAFMTALARLDRHRQHRRRRDRDRLRRARARSSGSGATASSPRRSSSPRPCSGSASASSAAAACRRGRCTTCATASGCRGSAGSTPSSPASRRSPPRPSPSPTRSRSCCRASSACPTLATGIVVAVLAWLVIIGGVTSIGRAAERLAPVKVGLYLAGGLLRDRCCTPTGCRRRCRWSSARRSRCARRPAARPGSASWSRCATAWRAASTRTRPATARRPWPTAPRAASGRCSRG